MRRADTTALAAGLLTLWLLAPGHAVALSSDRNEPVYIEADHATLNEQEGNSSYTGNVSLRQGTLHLSGDSMQVQLKNNRIERIVLQGSPARFVQRPDGADTDQQAEAGHIEYHAASQRLLLEHDAHIRQVGKEEFSSDRIEFNLADNSVNAGGTDGRVHITLQPEHGDADAGQDDAAAANQDDDSAATAGDHAAPDPGATP